MASPTHTGSARNGARTTNLFCDADADTPAAAPTPPANDTGRRGRGLVVAVDDRAAGAGGRARRASRAHRPDLPESGQLPTARGARGPQRPAAAEAHRRSALRGAGRVRRGRGRAAARDQLAGAVAARGQQRPRAPARPARGGHARAHRRARADARPHLRARPGAPRGRGRAHRTGPRPALAARAGRRAPSARNDSSPPPARRPSTPGTSG